MNTRIKKLVDIYSQNLSMVAPEYKDKYACPLCLRLFEEHESTEDEEKQKLILTEEHIIPNKLNGRIYTLLCNECNSRCGARIDSHLINRSQAYSFLNGEGQYSMPVEIEIGDGKIRGDMFYSKNEIPQIRLEGKPNLVHPDQIKKSMEAIEEIESLKIDGDLRYNGRKSMIALLKIGYLLLFYCLGYEYILQKPLEKVRKQILNPDKVILEPKIMVMKHRIEENFKVFYVYLPKKYRCYLAVIDIMDKSLAIVLPEIDDDNCEIYKDLQNYDPQTSSEQLETFEIQFIPERLINSESQKLIEYLYNYRR